VHLRAVAAVQAGGAEVVLGAHELEVDALGDGVPGRPVGGIDQVDLVERPVVAQRRADAGGDRLLPGVEVIVAAVGRVIEHLVGHGALMPADAQDGRVHVDQFLVAQVLGPEADLAIGPGHAGGHGQADPGQSGDLEKAAPRGLRAGPCVGFRPAVVTLKSHLKSSLKAHGVACRRLRLGESPAPIIDGRQRRVPWPA
jgi:hypothetical protein